MATKIYIAGHNGKNEKVVAHLHNPECIDSDSSTCEAGMLVYTRDRFRKNNVTKFAVNSTYGAQMAQDGTATATITENINNGGDNAYWTPSNISGNPFNFTSTFSSTGWPVDGTQSIDGTGTNNNSLARIDKGSTIDLTPYVSVRGSIYVVNWDTRGTKQVLVGFQDSSNVDVGIKVDIGSYIDTNLTATRQDFTIPLSDMGVEGLTVQSLVIDPVDIGSGPPVDFYLDVLKMQDVGEGIEYTILPDESTNFYVNQISIMVEDAYVVANQEGSFGKSGFLGLSSLTEGLLLGATKNNAPIAGRSALVKDLRDWMQFPQLVKVFSGSDGTNTWVNFILDFSENGGIPLRSSQREGLTYRVQDDMSGLEDLKVTVSGYTLEDS